LLKSVEITKNIWEKSLKTFEIRKRKALDKHGKLQLNIQMISKEIKEL